MRDAGGGRDPSRKRRLGWWRSRLKSIDQISGMTSLSSLELARRALTGLAVVAMSLHVAAIVNDPLCDIAP
jgi:hypothetical protein